MDTIKPFPVRITVAIVLGILSIFVIMGTWYITQPMVYKFLDESQGMTQTIEIGGDTINTTGSDQTYTILKYINLWWGPAFVLVLIVYLFARAHRRDPRGEYYG